jgi:uncharacterized membrane protein
MWIGAAGLGALLAYLMDPASGRRRRSRIRDRAVHIRHVGRDTARKALVDAEHRAQGAVSGLRSRFQHEPVTDEVLTERVRSRLGRIVSHPHAIQVHCQDGLVTLSGPILKREAKRLVRSVRRLSGVADVQEQLERYESGEHVPSLQGGERRLERPELLQTNWSPAYRMFGVAAGGGLLAYGIRARGWSGALVAGVGGALLLRAVTNLPFRRLTGIGAGPSAVHLTKHIHIDVAPEEVFAFFRAMENFPRFMSHLRSVEPKNGHWHWVANGPAGIPVSWNAEVTELRPNEMLSWQSISGSAVQTSGSVRMEPAKEGTLVEVRLSYTPPAGAIGHAVAALFGADPKRALDDDMVRLKSLLETGKATAHGHTVYKEEVAPEEEYGGRFEPGQS